MLSIQLLGTPQILQDDRPLTITRKMSRALLYYLAAHDQPLTREQLLAVFWQDSDRVSAQQVLRTTLHGLRQVLGDFLAGFSLSDSAEFYNWLAEQQEHYRRLAVRGFIALAALHEQQQDYAAELAFDPKDDLSSSALRMGSDVLCQIRLGNSQARLILRAR